jgi:hypothetical protein
MESDAHLVGLAYQEYASARRGPYVGAWRKTRCKEPFAQRIKILSQAVQRREDGAESGCVAAVRQEETNGPPLCPVERNGQQEGSN